MTAWLLCSQMAQSNTWHFFSTGVWILKLPQEVCYNCKITICYLMLNTYLDCTYQAMKRMLGAFNVPFTKGEEK
jgi:hypothetical protein